MKSRFFYKVTFQYFFFVLIVLLPLLKLGYVQTFDMAWGPILPQAASSNNDWLLHYLLSTVSILLTSVVTQKILLFSLFFLSAVGAHRLSLQNKFLAQYKSTAYLAGLLYMFNPFIYTRLMAGQWLVLCGYALLPWAVRSLWQLMQKPSIHTSLAAAAWTAAVGLTSIHAVGFVAMCALALLLVSGKQNLADRFKWCGLSLSVWLLANSLWLLSSIFGSSHTTTQINSFGPSQLHAFATSGTVASNVPLSSLLLEGFWADGQGRYVLPSHLGIWWYGLIGLLAIIMIIGVYTIIKRRDRLGLTLIALALIAWWLGMGVGWRVSAGASSWLIAHVPFYRGYREPQKWLMVLALSYTYFAATGMAALLAIIKKVSLRPPALMASLLLPILITPTLLWGAGGQLVSAQYPSDWATAKRTLNNDKTSYQVLILPWHQYLPLSFTKRVVANPTSHYFKQSLIISDNPELAGVPPDQSSPVYRLIDNQLLPSRYQRLDAADQLTPYHVKYVILLKEADWQQYGWVRQQSRFRLIQDTAHLQLYQIEAVK